MNNASTIQCPQHVELAEFLHGAVSAARLDEIAEHLEHCPACNAAIEQAAVHDTIVDPDTLPASARRPAAVEAVWNEPECARMMAAAKALPEAPRHLPAGLAARPLPPSLGQYEVLERIGAGGMGAVYKARHKRLDRVVALKVIAEHRITDAQTLDRFVREWVALAKLENEHIVRAIDADEDQGFHFLVIEYVEGIDLAKLVRRGGRLSVPDACEAIRQAALGLQYVAKRDMVHRDIKPSNLMIAVDGTVKILDLGLALWQSDDSARSGLTSDQQILGTVDFMAPEQALDSHTVDIRGDIYSLGCTLYYLLCGEAPFGSEGYSSTLKKLLAHSQAPPPAASKLCPDVPPRLDALLRRMMAKSPSDRPSTATKLTADLAQFTAGSDLARLVAADVSANSNARGVTAAPYRRRMWRTRLSAASASFSRLVPRRRTTVAVAAVLAATLLGLGYLGIKSMIAGGRMRSADSKPLLPASVDLNSWQNLLVEAPEALLFNAHDGASWLQYDHDKGQARFNSVGDAVLQLGSTANSNYEFIATLSQNPLTGGIGVFFGCHKSDDQGWRFQLLRVRTAAAGDAATPLTVDRCVGALPNKTDGFRLTGLRYRGYAHLQQRAAHTIRFVVRDGELSEVWFDDELLPGLIGDLADAGPLIDAGLYNAMGGFGIYAKDAGAAVNQAQFRVLSSPTRDGVDQSVSVLPSEGLVVELPVGQNGAKALLRDGVHLTCVVGGNAYDKDGKPAIAVAAKIYPPGAAIPPQPPLTDPSIRTVKVDSQGVFKFNTLPTYVPGAVATTSGPGAPNILAIWPQYNDHSWGYRLAQQFYGRESQTETDCGPPMPDPK